LCTASDGDPVVCIAKYVALVFCVCFNFLRAGFNVQFLRTTDETDCEVGEDEVDEEQEQEEAEEEASSEDPKSAAAKN
jgi:hypothetical protein